MLLEIGNLKSRLEKNGQVKGRFLIAEFSSSHLKEMKCTFRRTPWARGALP
jgi:hypothetical protein